MGTVPEQEPESPTRIERVSGVVRTVIGGHESAAVRRQLLYFTAIMCIGLTPASLWPPFAIISLAAVLLLAMTDQLA